MKHPQNALALKCRDSGDEPEVLALASDNVYQCDSVNPCDSVIPCDGVYPCDYVYQRCHFHTTKEFPLTLYYARKKVFRNKISCARTGSLQSNDARCAIQNKSILDWAPVGEEAPSLTDRGWVYPLSSWLTLVGSSLGEGGGGGVGLGAWMDLHLPGEVGWKGVDTSYTHRYASPSLSER